AVRAALWIEASGGYKFPLPYEQREGAARANSAADMDPVARPSWKAIEAPALFHVHALWS
ncbi:hypothetical protein ABTM66_19590, partial [Acinetobacter baumannii]